MCLSFHVKVVHLFGMLKKKSIHAKYLCLLPQEIFYPGLPNLGSQIRCAQNRYNRYANRPKIPPDK